MLSAEGDGRCFVDDVHVRQMCEEEYEWKNKEDDERETTTAGRVTMTGISAPEATEPGTTLAFATDSTDVDLDLIIDT